MKLSSQMEAWLGMTKNGVICGSPKAESLVGSVMRWSEGRGWGATGPEEWGAWMLRAAMRPRLELQGH